MEVNINNAFFIVVKISWKYCNNSLENVTITFLKTFEWLIIALLENPVFTTLFLTTCAIFILILISASILINTAVSCLLAVIIVCEGIIGLAFMLLLGIILSCFTLTLAVKHGMHMWLIKLFKLDT
ncbi:uncharacterized protein LOC114355560 [Ostrinia furnacalis]|uniref:uncharacterized protein LOC114355560 n=1 Tax=Ostrinia furnacalis TaxID=93504 RepID=UPI00103C6036|nr:uncharacterized protein LOC114355560 [Ostrinia furnacalis]